MRHISTTATAALLCLPLLGGPVQAQESTTTPQSGADNGAEPVRFDAQVVVTAERAEEDRDRLPASTSVITAQELEQRPASTFADAVQMLPGFHVFFTEGSGLTPSSMARGFFGGGESEYVTVLVDGIPLGDVESGVVDWRRVPIVAIQRVEALRGPASPVYGDTALGGVIQIFTAVPTRRTGRVTATAGSFSSASAAAEFAQPIGAIGIHAVGSFIRNGGFRSHSNSREGFGTVSAHRTAGGHRWTARGVLTYVDRDEPGPLTAPQLITRREASDPIFRFDRETTHVGYGALRYVFGGGPYTGSLLGRLSGRTGDRVRTLLFAPDVGDRAKREIGTLAIGSAFENSVETSLGAVPGQLRFGADWERDQIESYYFPVSSNGRVGPESSALEGRRLQVGAYATQSFDIGPRLALHAGVRWDGLRDRLTDGTLASHAAWSPRIGGVLALPAGANVFAQISRAFKAPTLDQLFDRRPFPDFQGGTFFLSSPLLLPQRGTNIEAGVRQSARLFRWEAVVYYMRMREEIDFDPATFRYANIGRSTHRGVEADAALLRAGVVSLGVNYTWTQVVPDGQEDVQQLRNIPRHVLRPNVTFDGPAGLSVHARYILTAGAFVDDAGQIPLGDRSTIDVRITKRVSRTTLRFDALNLTNDQFEEVGSLLPDFGAGAAPVYFPGTGVVLRGGFELAF